jgi:hypothetical protein
VRRSLEELQHELLKPLAAGLVKTLIKQNGQAVVAGMLFAVVRLLPQGSFKGRRGDGEKGRRGEGEKGRRVAG